MISTILYVIGAIFIILAAAAFLGIFHVGAGAGALLIFGIIALVVAYFLGRPRTASRL